jgi:hypothetical protein
LALSLPRVTNARCGRLWRGDAVSMNNTDCTTTKLINTHFAPCYPATCTVTTFFTHYSAGDQDLVEHEWKNASDDRGGNHGDIRSTNVP